MRLKSNSNTASCFVIVLTFLLLAQTLLLVRNYSQPWNGIDGGDGAFFSSIARNYINYGIFELKGGQVTNFGEVNNKSELNFYQHHPPMVPLLTYLSFNVFGESEGAARLAPILFTIGSGIILFSLIRSFFGFPIGLLATFFFASFPMTIIIGRKVGYESPTLFFILLTINFYFRFVKTRSKKDLIGFFIALAAGLLTDWAAYFIVPIFMSHYWATQQAGQFKKIIIIGLPILAISAFGLFILNTWLAAPGLVYSVFYQGMAYIGLIAPTSELAKHYIEAQLDVSLWKYFKHILKILDQLFSYPIILLALTGGFILIKDGKLTNKVWVIIILITVPILNWLLFWKSMYFHIVWGYYFTAPLAVLAAIATNKFIAIAEGMRHANNTSVVLGAFIILMTIVGSMSRIVILHQEQVKLLPDDQFEQANFIKDVAKEITKNSAPDSIILTNLPKSGTDRILPYYAHRNIVGELNSVEKIDHFLKGKQDKNKIYFLLHINSFSNENKFIDYLNFSGRKINFSTQNNQFILFKFFN